ncbi:MAG: hypothetical protein IPJ34_02875 [Myxococcales bacterium]|nr:hypothetical protein [Myxococcales bacterium]
MHRNRFWLALLGSTALVGGCSPDSSGTPDADAGGTEACANVEALRATCSPLPERFDASTTLVKGCYRASKTPVLGADVTLTIAPGVTILFAENAGLHVSAKQALVAAGTKEEPICLTGDKALRGSWDGVTLGRTEGADDRLDYVTIEYAGSTKSDAEAAGIKVVSDSRIARVSLTHTTVRESQGFGLYLVGSAETPAFGGNTFTKNSLGPASVDSDVAGLLDATSKYGGNGVDEVRVRTNRLSKNLTWRAIGVPFHLSGNLSVVAPWVLEAPTTLIMSADSWISVNGDVAGLRAVGTADKPVLFTGETKTRGAWEALRFDGTNNATNRLEYVTVEYGGGTKHDAAGAGVKAIADSHGVTLSLSNTTIRECEGFGLYLAGSAVTPTFAKNIFTKNGLGPVSVGSQAVHQLETSSTYTGNVVDHLRVPGDRVGKTVTWLDLGVPYELEGNIHVDLVWTLSPGVTLLMAKDSWISVAGDAAGLSAVGSAVKPITISGIEKTKGFWHGIVFDATLNAANALAYATVEYGGSLGGGGERGMIQAHADSHGVVISVKNSTIRNSGQYGIWLGASAKYNSDIETSNTFANNTSGNVFKDL